jgi:NtrC-family two-component system sensor histidine kinase KinB
MDATFSTLSINLSRDIFRRWYLSVIAVAVAATILPAIAGGTNPSATPALGCVCFFSLYVVYALNQVTANHPEGSMAGLTMPLITAYFTLGLLPALLLLLAGSATAGLVQFLFGFTQRNTPLTQRFVIIRGKLLREIGGLGSGLLTGALVYTALKGPQPLSDIDSSVLLPVILLIVTNITVRELVLRYTILPPDAPPIDEHATPHQHQRSAQLYEFSSTMILDGTLVLTTVPVTYTYFNNIPPIFMLTVWILIMAAIALRIFGLSRTALRRRIDELVMLNMLSKSIAAAANTSDLYGTIYVQVSRLLDAPLFYIAIADTKRQNLHFPLVVRNGQRLTWPPRPWHRGTPETILEREQPLLSYTGQEAIYHQTGPLTSDRAEPCRSAIGVPLQMPDSGQGVMVVQHPTRTGVYTEADLRLMETLAAQSAIALRNTSLRDQAQQFTEGLVAVNHVSNAINASLDTEVILQQICTVARSLANASSAAIFLKSDETMVFEPVYSINLSGDVQSGLAASVVQAHEHWNDLLHAPNLNSINVTHDDEELAWLVRLVEPDAIRSMTITPFVSVRSMVNEHTLSPTRDVIGFQMVFYHAPHTSGENEQHLLRMLASQAAVAIENANLFGETQNTVRRLAYLAEATRIFTDSLELTRVSQSTVDWIVDALEMDTATLALWDEDQDRLIVQAHARGYQATPNVSTPDFSQPLDNLPEFKQALQGRWSNVFTTSEAKISRGLQEMFHRTGLHALALTPLVVRNEVTGLMVLGSTRPQGFPPDDINLAESLAGQAATAIQNAQFHAMTETQLSARVTEISVLEDVLRRISASVDEIDIIHDVLQAGYTVTRADMIACSLVTSVNTAQVFWRTSRNPRMVHDLEYEDISRGITGRVLATGEPAMVPDTSQEPDYWIPHGTEGFQSELSVPILHQGEALGTLNIESVRLNSFDESHMRFLQSLAGHTAVALARARLFESNRRQIDVLNTIRELSQYLLDAYDLNVVLDLVCTAVMKLIDALNVHIYFYDPVEESLTFATSMWRDGRRNYEVSKPRPDGLTFQGVRAGKPFVSADFEPVEGIHTRRLGIFPLKHGTQTVGVLNVAVEEPHLLAGDTVRALELLTNQAASAIERVRLFEDRRAQIEVLRALRNNSLELLNTMDMDTVVELVCRSAQLMTGGEDVHVYFYDAESDQLTFGGSVWRDGRRNIEAAVPRPNGVTYRTARTGMPQIINRQDIPTTRHDSEPVQAVAGVPLKHADQVVGVLNVAVTDPARLDADGLRALELLANQSAAAMLNVNLYENVRSGRDQMQVILTTVRDGLMLVDRHGTMVHVNPAAELLLNVDLRQYVGQNMMRVIHTLNREYPELVSEAIHADNVKALWRTLRNDPYQVYNRAYAVEKRGETAYLEEESAPVLAENGEAVGRLFVWHDVTETHLVQEAREELTNTIIHDLRGPLTAILGGLSMLPEMVQDVETMDLPVINEVIEIAHNSTESLLSMVESLLDVARMDSGNLALEQEPTPLNEPLDNALRLLNMLASNTRVTLATDVPPDFPPLHIESDKVRRVLINLVDNALRYTPRDGSVTVHAECAPDGAQAIISVVDTGPGIPAEMRDRIFERYATGVTGQAKKKHRGLGLGLTFCKMAVEAHGGRIWVEDGLEGGAAFRFTLPISS